VMAAGRANILTWAARLAFEYHGLSDSYGGFELGSDLAFSAAAGVRVLVESGDHHRRWSTVGCSTNIIEASWSALADAFEYAIIVAQGGSGLAGEHLEVVRLEREATAAG